MLRKIILSEKQFEQLVNKITEDVNENIFSDAYYGLKGVWRGYGYNFYKYTNQVDNIARTMLRKTAGLDAQANNLVEINRTVGQLNIPQQSKDELRNEVNNLLTSFQQYQQSLQNLRAWSQRTIS